MLPVVAALASNPLASGYTFIFSDTKLPVKWTPEKTTIVMKIMADNSTRLGDGTTQATCIQAAMTDSVRGWNRYLGDVQFSPQVVPIGSGGADGNSSNEIFFSNKPYNQSWDTNTLAVTTIWLSGNQRKEADIIINTAYTWDSYRGTSRVTGSTGPYDLQRVVLHELGHVLGLDHPDQATPAQTVAAIMNSIVSNIDSVASDDIAGARSLYGAAGSAPANDNFANAFAITLAGTSAQVTGTNVNASRQTGEPAHSDEAGGHSVWWKWSAPAGGSVSLDTQGSLFDTTLGVYTGPSLTQLTEVAFSDDLEDRAIQYSSLTFAATAGTTYYFAVDGFNADDGFGADSAAVTLNVNFAATGGTAPAITSQPVSEAATPGGSVTFAVTATGASLNYQWSRNGTPLSGATNSILVLGNVQAANTGNYTVTISNSGGAVTSNPAALTLGSALSNSTVTTGHNAMINAGGAVGAIQWQVSTNSGGSWTNLGDDSVYHGSTTTVLEISGATSAMNGYEYRYVATSSGNVSTSNAVTLVVGPALLPTPVCIAVNGAGVLLVGDASTDTIQSVTPGGMVTLVAGANLQAGSADGKGAAAQFNNPSGIAYDTDGNLYVADTANGTIRRIAVDGTVTTLAGSTTGRGNVDGSGASATFSAPTGIAAVGTKLFVADATNNTIRQVTTAGVVTTFAGSAGQSGSNDGSGGAARFNHPGGVAVDGNGTVYVTDSTNNTIRKITPAGVVTTLAGLAGVSGSQDGTGGGASFNNPTGITVDSAGNLYVADTGNSTIRAITPAGVVTTLAGLPTIAGLDDGTNAALFNQPRALAIDASNNLFVVDTGNAAIRKVTLSGAVNTVALTAASAPAPAPTPTPTPTPTPAPAPTPAASGGGGSVEGWFVSVLGLIGFSRRRSWKRAG